MIRYRQHASDGRSTRAWRWLEAWTGTRRARVAGANPWKVTVEAGRGASRHHLTGTAAEMSFYAVLGLVPLTLAFGAALGHVQRLVGTERIAEGQDAAIVVLTTLLGPELTADTVAPFVRAQLAQERGGLALGSLVVALWLGSRMFTPALRALDLAHGVDERRSGLHQRLVALGLAVGTFVASLFTLLIMIVGPLLGTAQTFAEQLGLGRTYRLLWIVGRWPLLLLLLIGFLVCFYRFAPSTRPSWRSCVPGAVLGMAVWILVALGFRLYLAVAGRPEAGVAAQEEAITLVGRAVGGVVATMLWTFLSSVALLLGGEVNAVLARRRADERD